MDLYTPVITFFLTSLVSILPALTSWLGVPMQERDTIQRTLEWPAGDAGRTLELSNVRGNVRIVGEDRLDVMVTARRAVERGVPESARSVPFDVRLLGGRLLICGDAAHCGCRGESRGEDHGGRDRSQVRVDFEVRVPRAVTLDVCAVAGDVKAEGTTGPYALRSVSGDVTLIGVRGHGQARTVTGDIDAAFAAPPEQAAGFRTVSGDVDVTMPASLSADLRLRTLHGDLLVGFDTRPLPTSAGERQGGRTVYSSDRFTSVRVGSGGPVVTLETVNGDVRVRKQP